MNIWLLLALAILPAQAETPPPAVLSVQAIFFEPGFKNPKPIEPSPVPLRLKNGEQVVVMITAYGQPGAKIFMPMSCSTEHDDPMTGGVYLTPSVDLKDKEIDRNGVMVYYRVLTPSYRSGCLLQVYTENEPALTRWRMMVRGRLFF